MPWDAPAYAVLLDLPLGIVMWLAMCRFFMLFVVDEDSKTPVMRVLNAIVGPLLRVLERLIPAWVSYRVTPLLLAVILLVLRYYLMPLLIGYDVLGISSLPLEYLIVSSVADLTS